jgi:valyl-tRNA synthetase
VKMNEQKLIDRFWPVVQKLSNLSFVSFENDKPQNASGFVIKSMECFIPLNGKVDAARERDRILKELEYQKEFLQSVEKKLTNEKFMKSAPPRVIETERKKKEDAEAKIRAYEEALKGL